MAACELDDWASERALLELLQKQLRSEGAVTAVLRHFAHRPEVQQHLAKLILRRSTDERIVAAVEAVLFGGAIDWNAVDIAVSEVEGIEAQITKLRELSARAPSDPNGQIRLVRLLARAGRGDEALALGRRLRDRGPMTLRIARSLGDVLARGGLKEEAVRTYSEIVEFDPFDVASRRLLGDIFLSRGWYEPAYAQYRTAIDVAPSDALAQLRLGAAAAGTGRIDEALRLERTVAGSQGQPGPDDPRRWARLWSAARLGRLWLKPPEGATRPAIERKLKELQLFGGPGMLVLLTWEDLSANVQLTATVDDKETATGEAIDAAAVGLSGILGQPGDFGQVTFGARLRSVPREEDLALRRQELRWDGKRFEVTMSDAKLSAGELGATL